MNTFKLAKALRVDTTCKKEEIISLLHCYSMKLYSKRHKDKKTIEVGIG